jgi:DNA (cytosine-5)-methyltransferase 1
LFTGAGGMDIGVRQAGFDVIGEVEFDPNACKTLRAAATREGRNTIIVEADIRKIDPKTLMKDLGLKAGELDLLFGGPPCQSFSLAGKQRGLDDERGMLLFEMARFASVFKPKAILIEQVKGLLSAKGSKGGRGEVFDRFIKDIEAIHFRPKWKVLLAADFGVPQLRQRLFVVATRGRNGFLFPDQTHAPKEESAGLFAYKPHTTVGSVLNGLGKITKKELRSTREDYGFSHVDATPDRDRERIQPVPEGSYLAAQTHVSKSLRKNLTAKDTTKYLRVSRSRPANTLRCGEIFYHPLEDRYLTPREYMRIHGYPDDYKLIGPIRSRSGSVRNLDQHRLVANSVPPPVAHALARQISLYLDEQNI